MNALVRILLIYSFMLVLVPARSFAADEAYLAAVIERADEEKLYEKLEWRRLLHYEDNLVVPGVTSLVDDPDFFFASDGKVNPKTELEATIRAFFVEHDGHERGNSRCRFIARFTWLDRELKFNREHLPPTNCEGFSEWYDALNPSGLSLIFPSAYLNSPASMFGHTFLRIDGKDQDESTRLLAYAANYGVAATDPEGFMFALKGLVGLYNGYFSVTPYYNKVKEYNDLENRDIWEYQLNFSPLELDMLLMHLWELEGISFEYYFFDENCSYHLLSLFEAARPELDLSSRFRWWGIPADTVVAVVEEPGLFSRAVYRPAKSTLLRHKINEASSAERSLAYDLSHGEVSLDDIPTELKTAQSQARVYELAYDFLEYERIRGFRPREDTAPLAHSILKKRSELDIEQAYDPVPIPAVRPDQGHNTQRMTLASGKDDNDWFWEMAYRPAYHDLIDPGGGYVNGGELVFTEFAFRQSETEQLKFERFTPLQIISLSPRNEFIHLLSWQFTMEAARMRFRDGEREVFGTMNGGPGLAYELGSTGLLYILANFESSYSPDFRENYALGTGVVSGVSLDISERYRVMLEGQAQRLFAGDEHNQELVSLQQRFSISDNIALRLDLVREGSFDNYWSRAELLLHVYY